MKIIQYDANFYMQILNQVSDIVLTLNFDGQIIEVNQAAVDNYGYTREELLAKNIVDLGKEEHIRKDGSSFSVDIQSKSFIHGDDIYFVNIVLPSCDGEKREKIIEVDTQPMLMRDGDLILEERELIHNFSFRNIEAGKWEMNLKNRKIRHSSSLATMLGEDEKSTFSVKSIMRKIVPEDRYLLRTIVGAAVKERTVFTLEFRLNKYSVESERWAQLIGKVSDEKEGEPEFIRGLLFDITSRKLAEKKKQELIIKKHEKFMNDIIGYLDFPLLIIDTQYRYKAYNKCHADAMRAMYGTDIELGQSLLSYISKDIDRATALRNFSKVFAGETIIQEDHAGDEKRQRNYYVGVFYPIRDENKMVVGAAAFFRDITEYTKNKEALEKSERRYQQLVEDANLIIIKVDENENIIFINECGLNLFSYSQHELIGKNFIKMLIPSNESVHRTNIIAMQQKNKESIRDTIEMVDRSGERLWLTLTYRWLSDKHDVYKGFIVIGTDVTKNVMARQTEKKRYKRELREKMMNEAILKVLSHEELILKIRQLGIYTSEKYIVILLQKSGYKSSNLENVIFGKDSYKDELLIDWLNDSNEKIAWFAPDGICIMWFCQKIKKEVVADLVKTLFLRVSQFSPSLKVKCGVSHTSQKFIEFVDIYEQALAAATYGELFWGERQWFYWQEFGSYQMILKSIHSKEALQFLEDQLGPLLELENEERRGLFLNTLREIVSCDSPEKISGRMHCHPGTVRYRKKVLGELLGHDFDSLNKIIDLKIALKIMDILEMNL